MGHRYGALVLQEFEESRREEHFAPDDGDQPHQFLACVPFRLYMRIH